jgi:outer membrane protein TolC
MGLWGAEVDFFVPDRLPGLPARLTGGERIEAEALSNRVDLRIARLEVEAVARSYGLTRATRYVTDLDLVAGVEAEREIETDYEINGSVLEETKTRKTLVTPQIEMEFVIPIFDSGQARLRKAEMAYMRAANLLAEKAVNIRSEARSAYTAYRSTHAIARHYRNAVLLSVNAKKQFWLADANLATAIYGGGAAASSEGATPQVADAGGAH